MAGRHLRNRYDALPPAPPWWVRLHDAPRGAVIAWAAALAGVLALWLGWYLYTLPVRGELHRVQRHLNAQPEVEDVRLSIPWFTRTMPESVDLTATGLPHGYSYEVHVELHGSYNPHTRLAHFEGVKQVLTPYEKVVIKSDRPVPPPPPD